MRPVLVEIPSKLLFFLALILSGVSFVRDRRKAPGRPAAGGNGLFYLVVAFAVMAFRGGSYVPTPSVFRTPWLPVPIFSYGVMLGTAMVVGWFLALRLAQNDGIPKDQAGAVYMWTAVWSIVGARVLYVIVQFREFDSVLGPFKIWQGGLVAYGGMIGGFLASWYNCRRRGIPLLQWADASAPSVLLGTAITRVGCLLFGCDYGRRTDLPWGIRFPRTAPAWEDHLHNGWIQSESLSSLPIHPTQVYEMIVGLLVFGLCMLLRRWRKFSGLPFIGWVVGYGIGRPIVEFFRDDDQRGNVGPLSTSQFIGIVATCLGLALLAVLVRRYRRDPQAGRLWERPLRGT